MVSGCAADLRYRARAYGFRIWIRNFFVPMYGQHDLTGRIVSVAMRTVVLCGRGFAFIIEALLCAGIIFIWMAVLPALVIFLVINLAGGV